MQARSNQYDKYDMSLTTFFACQVKVTIHLYPNASYCFLPGYAKYKRLRIFGF